MKIKFGKEERNFSNFEEARQFAKDELERVDGKIAMVKKEMKELKGCRRELAKALTTEPEKKETREK